MLPLLDTASDYAPHFAVEAQTATLRTLPAAPQTNGALIDFPVRYREMIAA
jgi:hypothetical protein